MTNKKTNDVRVVPVDLIERAMLACFEAGHGITHDELRAILAQPADQQGEPVGQWSDDDGISWCDGNESSLASARASGWLTRTLYRHAQPATAEVDESYPPCDYCGTVPDYHPWHGAGVINGEESPHIHACTECRHKLPATAKVVLPERKREATEDSDIMIDCQNEGWNACLDEVAKLNTPQ